MELHKLADIKVDNTQSRGSVRNSVSEAKGSSEAQQKSPFEEQLNNQIDQAKSNAKTEKIEANQQYNESASEASGIDDAAENSPEPAAVAAQEVPEELVDINIDPDLLPGQISLEGANESASVSATLLPSTGNSLPLSGVIVSESTARGEAVSQPAAAVMQQQASAVMLDVNQARQIQAPLVASTVQAPVAEAEYLTVDMRAFNPANINDRIGLQNHQYSSVMSEMPTAEMIAQTTRMQQVPITTAINQVLPAGQSMNIAPAAIIADTAAVSVNPLNTGFTSSITANVLSPEWSQQMTEKVSLMLKGGVQRAEIKLNPAHLGPMEIKLSINDDQASVNFVAHHAQVRDALDASMPRLRDMLEQQGLNLSDVDVSTQSEQQAKEQADEESTQGGLASADNGQTNDQLQDANAASAVSVNMQLDSGVSIYA